MGEVSESERGSAEVFESSVSGRTRAIREVLLQAPAPIVARMLGYDSTYAEDLAADAGTT